MIHSRACITPKTLGTDTRSFAYTPDSAGKHDESALHLLCHGFLKTQKRTVLYDLMESLTEVVFILDSLFAKRTNLISAVYLFEIRLTSAPVPRVKPVARCP